MVYLFCRRLICDNPNACVVGYEDNRLLGPNLETTGIISLEALSIYCKEDDIDHNHLF